MFKLIVALFAIFALAAAKPSGVLLSSPALVPAVSKAYVAAPLISAPVVKSYAAPIASYSSYSVAAAPVVSAYAAPAYSAYSAYGAYGASPYGGVYSSY